VTVEEVAHHLCSLRPDQNIIDIDKFMSFADEYFSVGLYSPVNSSSAS
jgi:hypothetical protein